MSGTSVCSLFLEEYITRVKALHSDMTKLEDWCQGVLMKHGWTSCNGENFGSIVNVHQKASLMEKTPDYHVGNILSVHIGQPLSSHCNFC